MFIGFAVILLILLFLLWRIESERMERVRIVIVDSLQPVAELGSKPLMIISGFAEGLNAHMRLSDRATELESEVARLRQWQERAHLLEMENAELRQLLNTPNSSSQTAISAKVIADTGSHFRHSVLVNVGSENGVKNGWPVVDNIGLAGRILGVGRKTSRVLLLSDTSSRVPIKIFDTNASGIAVGDSTSMPQLNFVAAADLSIGSRVETSGEGGVFPPGILLGKVVLGKDRIARVGLSADLKNLEYVNLLRVENREITPLVEGIVTTPAPDGLTQ